MAIVADTDGECPTGLAALLRRLEEQLMIELERFEFAQESSPTIPGLVIHASEAAQSLYELGNEELNHTDDPAYLGKPLKLAPGSQISGLDHAVEVFGLSAFERDLLVLALSVELDRRYARIIAYLNDHMERTRPTVGLSLRLFAGLGRSNAALARFGESHPCATRG